MVVAQLLLRGFELKPFFFYKVAYHAQLFDVGSGVEPCPLVVAFGIDDCEPALPETERGRWETDDFGHLADFVIFFLNIVHGVLVRRMASSEVFRPGVAIVIFLAKIAKKS